MVEHELISLVTFMKYSNFVTCTIATIIAIIYFFKKDKESFDDAISMALMCLFFGFIWPLIVIVGIIFAIKEGFNYLTENWWK